MLVREKFKDKGLFETMSQYNAIPFEMDSKTIDNLFMGMYGGRICSYMCEVSDVETLATMFSDLYKTDWLERYNTRKLMSEIANKGNSETTQEKGNTTQESTGTNTALNSVSAFNDDDFVNDTQNDTTNTLKANDSTAKEKTTTKNDINYVKLSNNLLQKNFLCDIIFVDVVKLATLSIF
jgi:hypothetical protein